MFHHFYFPRPYPDELIGSLILRACRHSGISTKSMSIRLSTKCRSYIPLLMSANIMEIANATDMDAITLLWNHTVFPYVTAFMSANETMRLTQNLLGSHQIWNSALTQAATQGNWGQRFCLQCLSEDKTKFGEAYWHREHNLPFVLTCLKHNERLQVIVPKMEYPITHNYAIRFLPARRKGLSHELPFAWDIAKAINTLGVELLTTRNRMDPIEWAKEYRALASNKGAQQRGTGLSSPAFAQAFRGFYGQAFLQEAGLDFQLNTLAWPVIMLRENQGIPYSTPKHVLMKLFLEQAELRPIKVQYRSPGPSIRDYVAMDELYSRMVGQAIQAIQIKNIRVGVIQMLQELGILGTYRHNRENLPKTQALLIEFKRSEFAARQTGKRSRKRS